MTMTEKLRGDTATQFEEVELLLGQYAQIVAKSTDDEHDIYSKLILCVTNLMTDQHCV
jgi:hypothetical protein